MNNEIFAALAQYEFSPYNNALCVGTWNGYAVTLQQIRPRFYYVYLAIRLEKVPKDLKKTLKASLKQPGVKSAAAVERIMPNWARFQFVFGKNVDAAEYFSAQMNAVVSALRAAGVAPANTCAITGAANPDSLCVMTSQKYFGFQPVFASAVRQSGYEAQTKADENDANGSYLSGTVGAILGTLLGIAINLTTIVLVKRIYVVLFALIPIAAMVGYKLLKGKTNKFAVVVVFVLSFISVPLLEFLALSILAAKEYDLALGETMRSCAEHFFDAELLKDTGPEMLKFLLFMAVGLLISWGYVNNSLNSTQRQTTQAQLASVRPNPNRQ